MRVDFDTLRRQLNRTVDSLTKKVIDNIDSDKALYIEVEEIKGELDKLRELAITLSYTYSDEGFSTLDGDIDIVDIDDFYDSEQGNIIQFPLK